MKNSNESKFYDGINLLFEKTEIEEVVIEKRNKKDENGQDIKDDYEFDIYMPFKGEDVKIATIDSKGKIKPNEELQQNPNYSKEDKEKLIQMANYLTQGKGKVNLKEFKDKLNDPKTWEEIEKKRRKESKTKNKPEDKKDEKQKKIDENTNEEEEKKNIASKKHISEKDIFIVRKDSQLYKNYPQIRKEEPNLYFYRDQDGKVKAEYIDEKGNSQKSKFFNDSTTHIKEETVSLGKDGDDIKKQKPYQVMTTNRLKEYNSDTLDVRMNVYINQGHMDFEESRQGTNGEWTGYNLEGKGRDYNSKEINDLSKTTNNKAKPGDISNRYDTVEKTGLADDGVQLTDLSPRATIERFIKEGYSKIEAIHIYDYMRDPRNLPEEEAKKKVNEEIIEAQYKSKENEEEPFIPGPRTRRAE